MAYSSYGKYIMGREACERSLHGSSPPLQSSVRLRIHDLMFNARSNGLGVRRDDKGMR